MKILNIRFYITLLLSMIISAPSIADTATGMIRIESNHSVAATLDNLGKGASGTAVQNLNLMIGAPEDAAL